MKLEPELRADFMAEVANEDRPASQVMRELMCGYIEQCCQEREYDDYLQRRIESGRASMHAGRGRPNEKVEPTSAPKRSRVAAGRG